MKPYTRIKLSLRGLFLALVLPALAAGSLDAQSLTMVSGNGQVVNEYFLSNVMMVVQAKDGSGRPAPGVAVSWSITQGAGTIVRPSLTTDSSGLASATFLATAVPGGLSFVATTVTASAASGSVNFVITTVLIRQPNGNIAAPPVVQLLTPRQENLNITATSGRTVPGGVVVQVIAQAGPETGQPVPNVGVRIVNYLDPTVTAPAACNGPNGLVLTDNTGIGTCDLVVTGPPGTTQIAALVGEYQYTTPFNLEVTAGASCTFSLSAASQSFASSGGNGTFNVLTTPGCGWTASSNANWIAITSGASGSGNGTVNYAVSANSGAARSGSLSIAGQIYTVNQSGTSGANPLTITTPPGLLGGTVNSSYSTTLSATGGRPPYTWSLAGTLPAGLTLTSSTGVIAGTPTVAGSRTFTITVTDNVGATQSQTFTLNINGSSSSSFTISNGSFPNGAVGQSYTQALTASGGCITPFSPNPVFSVAGGSLPNGLSVTQFANGPYAITGTPAAPGGTFNFTLSATDACAHKATANFTITITGGGTALAQMSVSPASLSFTVQAGNVNIPADQTVTIGSSSGTVLNFTAALSGGNWLVAKSPLSGGTPGTVTVGVVNFVGLAPGPYSGSITIASQASNSPVVIAVSLTVIAAPAVVVNPLSFAVNAVASVNSPSLRQTITVSSNTGPVRFTASASTADATPWLFVSPTDGVAPSYVIALIAPQGLLPGIHSGTILITPVGGVPQSVTITLNVVSPPALAASPATLSFAYQQGAASPLPQTVILASTQTPLTFLAGPVTYSGGNWLTLDTSSGATPASLKVSANIIDLAPGQYKGAITVASSDPLVAPISVGVLLTISAPVPILTTINNAASNAAGPVAPGEFVALIGTSVGPASPASLQLTAAGTLDTTLAETRVWFDGVAAPLISVSASLVVAIVPYEVAGNATTRVQVEFKGVRSNTIEATVGASAPGIFTQDASGHGPGAIVNEDGTVNSAQNGAAPGSIVSIYGTGEGQTDPLVADGKIAADVRPKPRLDISVQIGDQPADLIDAGTAPGSVAGFLQVNARVPLGVPRGTAVPVVITVGDASSQPNVVLFVQP